jgi:hypothetical protein
MGNNETEATHKLASPTIIAVTSKTPAIGTKIPQLIFDL